MKHKEHFHGSDLEKIEKKYNIKKEDIISFSSNVNPLGISFKLKTSLSSHIDAITSYPDREYTDLRKAIGTYVDTDYKNILVGNGSTELISVLIQMKRPKKALILGPTYSEYEREITINGGRCHYFRLKEEDNFLLDLSALQTELTKDVDLLVLCNPNNPTSSYISQKDLRKMLDICKEKDIFVMVDETYVEFATNPESVTSIPLTEYYNNIIILRGISKFFAAPGLRLGYAICGNQDLIREINHKKNPWTINSLAAIAGEIMFSDEEYIQETRTLISKERERICNTLSQCNSLKLYPCNSNFVLVRILDETVTADDIFDAAIRKGLMIRNCSTFPFLDNQYFRFCFMMPDKNDALIEVILSFFKER